MRKKKSILFVRPDYHCSFFYREQLRNAGWKADIYLNTGYPEALLYSNEDLLKPPKLPWGNNILSKFLDHILLIIWWLLKFWRYEYHIYYGRPPAVSFLEERLGLTKLFGHDFLFELWLAKLGSIKLIFLPTGCNDDESKENFLKFDGGNICNNCGAWNRCNDNKNKLNFSRVNRYFDMVIGTGSIDSTQYHMTHFKYKSIDLSLWNPNIYIPIEHRLSDTGKIRILHTSYLEKSGRDWLGRNIKGTPYVLSAINRLKNEGHPVEYYYIHDKPSYQMRFYQAQADIVVEQLIYGWWGSTFIESSALGKPVICYLRPEWKDFFLKIFPEYDDLPVISATSETVYDELKKLVIDEEYRNRKGQESRTFAEQHFDTEKNARNFIDMIEKL